MADGIGLVEGNARKEYLRTIEQQLRYKKAYSEIERELNDHMEDQKQAYLAQGMDEEEAELRAVLHPEQYAEGADYTVMRAKNVAASATLTGTGDLGFFQNISGAYSDYIISCALSYFGILVVLLITAIVFAFLGRILHISRNQENTLGFLLGTAVFCTLLLKSMLYFAANLGIFPGTAVDMPFLSFGLNNTISNSILIGLVLSVNRYKKL